MNDCYIINNELYHHGVLGMKWGIRRYQPYRDGEKKGKEVGEAAKKSSKVNKQRILEKNIKSGKDKPNVNAAESITKDSGKAIDEAQNILKSYRNIRRIKTGAPDTSNMTDEQLKKAINRLDMERRYASLSAGETTKGLEYTKETLQILGSIAAIAGSAASVAGTIYAIKK